MPQPQPDPADLSYWAEAFAQALETTGLRLNLTRDQYGAAALVLSGWAENRATVFGEDCIPDPAVAEAAKFRAEQARLDREHATEIARWQEAVRELRADQQRLRDRLNL